jgi:hypothetical protein
MLLVYDSVYTCICIYVCVCVVMISTSIMGDFLAWAGNRYVAGFCFCVYTYLYVCVCARAYVCVCVF